MKHSVIKDRVYLYDSTLRDGAQTSGVDFSSNEKIDIAKKLNELAIDYIEGGWPGANPTDDAFFSNLPKLDYSEFSVFGMTKKVGDDDVTYDGLKNLIKTNIKNVAIVGKSWDFHVKNALKISLKDNLKIIADSVKYLRDNKKEVFFDAEHFFDGYLANKEFALDCIKVAYDNGARWIVLCDTNGGTLPDKIGDIISDVTNHIDGKYLGIHCHNDSGTAVASSLMAVDAGARQIQGTINGLGERCGNANLITVIPNLVLKKGYDIGLTEERMDKITHISNYLSEIINRNPDNYAPYVGKNAFAHKGGLHVSAVLKNPISYEHIEPKLVGNERRILVSDQAGKSNIVARLIEAGIEFDEKDPKLNTLIKEIKKRESEGYSYDIASASFELLAYSIIGQNEFPKYFTLKSFRIMDERRINAMGKQITVSEATIKLFVQDQLIMEVAEGNGPVNALDNALNKALIRHYPILAKTKLIDYKVRIIGSNIGTDSIIRVLIEMGDEENNRWGGIGVSTNIIDASFNALEDCINYYLFKTSKINNKY